ncbi:MAG: molybdopterin-dependent oxidoreductase [Desulfobacteraceae bacterium]|nr:molybdopterin-dependent oxidoreductase [Desulfobacteraceae bacterium]
MQQKKETIETFCLQDHMTCRIAVKVREGGSIQGIHPTDGFACLKCNKLQETIYHPDRLKYPLQNLGERGEGKWQRISWDKALDTMASKFKEIRGKYGSKTICSVIGSGHKYIPYGAGFLFSYVLNSPNTLDANQLCSIPVAMGSNATLGKMGWVPFHDNSPDYLNSKCIVLWGSNPIETRPPHAKAIRLAKSTNGAKLIIIDPRPTRMTKLADLWLQPRPGTDAALVLGMLNVIINEKFYNRNFVDKWCIGFEKLKERVQEYPPEKVAEITWIPREKIVEAARLYATNGPACIHPRLGVSAMQINVSQASRAIIILAAICGNLDVPGGNLLPQDHGGFDLRVSEFPLQPEVLSERIGSKEYPLLHANKTPDMPCAVRAMLKGDVKGIFIMASNFVINQGDIERNIEALKKIGFSVAVDLFMTPTAELADIVLPAAHFLETESPVADYQPPYNRVLAMRRVMEPVGECWDDRKIVIELAKRMDVQLPWKTLEEFNDWRCKPLNMTFKELQEREGQTISFPMKYKRYEEKGFNTPSGKVELYSSIFEKHGYDPLPNHVEPPESPYSTPELYKEYPLIHICHRVEEYVHTEARQLSSSLRKMKPDPYLEINPETGSNLGIKDGEWVALERPKFKRQIRFRARFTPDMPPYVVSSVFGWWFPEKPAPEYGCLESNINAIVSYDPPYDPIEGTYQVRGILCRINKL